MPSALGAADSLPCPRGSVGGQGPTVQPQQPHCPQTHGHLGLPSALPLTPGAASLLRAGCLAPSGAHPMLRLVASLGREVTLNVLVQPPGRLQAAATHTGRPGTVASGTRRPPKLLLASVSTAEARAAPRPTPGRPWPSYWAALDGVWSLILPGNDDHGALHAARGPPTQPGPPAPVSPHAGLRPVLPAGFRGRGPLLQAGMPCSPAAPGTNAS